MIAASAAISILNPSALKSNYGKFSALNNNYSAVLPKRFCLPANAFTYATLIENDNAIGRSEHSSINAVYPSSLIYTRSCSSKMRKRTQ